MGATIKLLDHQQYDQQELIDNMHSDAFYYVEMGLHKALSYSSIKWLLKSPKWFEYKRRNPDPETQALRDGRLVHSAILEPNKYDSFEFVDTSTKNTTKWKLAVEQYGAANTFTLKEKYMNDRIATAFLQNDKCVSYLNGAQTEVPIVESILGLPIRGKADILGDDFVADIKTTSDGVNRIVLNDGTVKNQFEFTIKKYDYDLQAYLYTQLFNVDRFVWLVIDKATTDIGVFEASHETLESGRVKLEAALEIYNAFFVDEVVDLSQYYISCEI